MQLSPQVLDFFTLFLSLIFEALPFITIGVIFSGILAEVPLITRLLNRLPRDTILTRFILGLVGFLMPVCECGNVPVAKRLIYQGFSVSDVTSFLLSAPILNPVTIWATLAAFSGNPEVAFFRVLGAVVISQFVSFLISQSRNQQEFLNERTLQILHHANHDSHHHEHDHNHDHEEDVHTHDSNPSKFSLKRFTNIITTEFVENTKMLAVGAIIAATVQIVVPRSLLLSLGSNIVLATIVMLILAFVVSICANVDAFFALAYSNIFPLGAIVTFLVFGPMIDIKILAMLRGAFTPKFLIMLTVIVGLSALSLGLLVNLLLL